MERHIHSYTIGVKMIASTLKKTDLAQRKYVKQNQPIYFSPTERKNNENKKTSS